MITFLRKHLFADSVKNEHAPHIFLILCFYTVVVVTYYAIFFPESLFTRLIIVASMLLSFIAIERSSLGNDLKAFWAPFTLIALIVVGAVYFGGDFLVYTYGIGGALISLTYMKPKGLMAYIVMLSAVQTFFLAVRGINMLGPNFTVVQNYLGLLSTIGINLVIYVFCKFYVRVLSALTIAKNEASQAAMVKGAFLSNMSHEIRTPMNAIIGMTAIGKASDDIETAHYTLSKIENASTHLLGVINDVLDISKLESGKFELSMEEFEFEKMIQRVMSVISFSAAEKEIDISVSVDENIHPVLIGDDQRISQIMINLLSNAVKFTPAKGFVGFNAILAEEKDDFCIIKVEVIDSGIGISPEQQLKLFQAFHQAEANTSRKFGGTGLGLSISKNISDMMNGKIEVESELGKGATFIFTFKAGIGRSAETARKKTQTEHSLPVFGNKHVLIAEDIEINREIVMALLAPTGLSFDCAKNGMEAVRMFAEAPQKYDMIFMDLQMPEMDGYEATMRIRSLNDEKAKTIPIIAMTANVFREDIEKCLAVGMNGHVGKPIVIDEVIAAVKDYFS